MSDDELKGTRVIPQAVEPGMFEHHMRGMQRGADTQPATTRPAD